MGDVNLRGGTVVTADGTFDADIAIRDGRIATVGTLPGDAAETVDVSGLLVMPGFIDAHTHMDMPFGGTITADDWDTGTAAAVAGGTTTIVDFALQDEGRSLGDAIDTWQGKAFGKTHIDFGLHVAICDLTDAVKAEIPSLPERGVCTVKVFMAYKGTSLFMPDEDLFEILQISRDAGVLVMVHAENGDVIAKLQAQALERGDVDPIWHARTRPEAERRERARDRVGGPGQLAPGVPPQLELERGRVGIDRHHGVEPFGERVHRRSGSRLGTASRSTIALPIGLPRRVYIRPWATAAR